MGVMKKKLLALRAFEKKSRILKKGCAVRSEELRRIKNDRCTTALLLNRLKKRLKPLSVGKKKTSKH